MGPLGAGLAALGVIGPGIGIGILTGMAAAPSAEIRTPPPTSGRRSSWARRSRKGSASSRSSSASCRSSWPSSQRHRERIVNLLALIGVPHAGSAVQAAAEAGAGLQINFFWVIVSSLNFVLFLFLANKLFGKTLSTMLASRRARIEQGLRDAEQARTDRANAEAERTATLAEARREARELLERAQKVAQETRDADIAATKAELERLREGATADIEAEKLRAMADCAPRWPIWPSRPPARSSARR